GEGDGAPTEEPGGRVTAGPAVLPVVRRGVQEAAGGDQSVSPWGGRLAPPADVSCTSVTAGSAGRRSEPAALPPRPLQPRDDEFEELAGPPGQGIDALGVLRPRHQRGEDVLARQRHGQPGERNRV